MEIVDVVDEKGTILYQAPKQEAHEKGLLHKTVIAEIINSKGWMILSKQNSDRQDAGQYVSPVGGHVSAGETDEEALKREAMEEAGIKNFSFKYKGKAIYQRHVIGRNENHYFVVYEIFTDEPIVLNHESVSYQSFSPDALKRALKKNPDMFGAAFHFVLKTFYPELGT
jgi:8-oxo-dGTP pyrophosphatase MutT (NUDIX family)